MTNTVTEEQSKIINSLERLLNKADKADLSLYVFDSHVYLAPSDFDIRSDNLFDRLDDMGAHVSTTIHCDGGAGV